MKYKFSELAFINPREKLIKGEIATKVSMQGIEENCRYIIQSSEEPYTGGSKFRNGDTLFARITPCLENGKIAQVNNLDRDEIAFGSTEFLVFRAKDEITIPDYVYFLSRWDYIRENAIKSMTGTSGRQRVPTSIFDELTVNIPDINTQIKVAAFLNLLDYKIRNNNKIISNLEEQAQAIFKSWFVDFEPFQDGKFIETELGLIPEGWEVTKLEKILNFENGSEPGAKNYYEIQEEDTLPFYRVGEMLSKTGIFVKKSILKGKIAEQEDVLVSFDGTVGRVVTGLEGGFSSGIKRISSKHEIITNSFIYVMFKSDLIQNIIHRHASGTTILHASKSIDFFYIPYNKEAVIEVSKIFTPIVELIRWLKHQNITLEEIRDALLPKLMAGEIDVSSITTKTEDKNYD